MRKTFFIILNLVFLINLSNKAFCASANSISNLTENTSIVGTDLLVIVDDPGGTPQTQKITATNVFDLIDTFSELDTIVTDKNLVNKSDGAVWTGAHDFGGSTSIEIPNGTTPSISVTGQIYVDTDLYSSAQGGMLVYDGVQSTYVVGTIDKPTDDQVPVYDSSTGTCSWETLPYGDITDVFNCSTGDCNQMTIGESEYLIGGAVDGTTDPYISAPQGTDCSSVTGEGRICWDTDDNVFYVGDGAAAQLVGGSGTGDITDVYNCSTGDCSSITMANTDGLDGGSALFIEIPNSTTPTVSNTGQVAVDTNLYSDMGIILINDGIQTAYVVATIDTPGDNEIPKYNRSLGNVSWEPDSQGSGDVTNVWSCSTGDCNTMTIGESEYLVGGAVDGTTDPYISLPQGSDCSSVTGEGRICWDSNDDALYIGDGASAIEIGQGSGDISDVYSCSTGDCNNLTIGENEYLIGGAVDGSTDPYISLPQGNDCSSVTGEGRICWDANDDALYIGDGATAIEIGQGSGDISDVWGCSSGDCNQITIGESEYLDGGAVDGTTDPYIALPRGADCSSVTTEGQVCWDTDDDKLYIGDGASASEVGGGGGGSSTGYMSLFVQSAKITGDFVVDSTISSSGAQIDAGEGSWKLLFDATTDEGATWNFLVPFSYSSNPISRVCYSMASATANEVEFEAALMCVSDGDSADVQTASFDTVNVSAVTVPGTAGYLDCTDITMTNNDSMAAGDLCSIILSTDADDATNDDATGDREVLGFELRWTE